MARRSHQTAWTVAFVAVVLVGALIMIVRFAGQEDPPPTGVAPSELSTGPTRAPSRPGDVTAVVRVTSSQPMIIACAQVPTAVKEKDREFCVRGSTGFRRRMRVNGPFIYITAFGEAGRDGAAVECMVRVSGKVKARESNSGAWQWTHCHAFLAAS